MEVPQNGWSVMENPIKDLGVPLFQETPLYIILYIMYILSFSKLSHNM